MNFTLKNKFLQFLVHIVAWGLFLSLLTSLVPRPMEMNKFLSVLIPDLFFISFYYINYFYLVPKFFIPGRYLVFGALCLSFLVLTIVVPSVISESSRMRPEFPHSGEMPENMPAPPQSDYNIPDFADQNGQPPDFHKPGSIDPGNQPPPDRFKLFIPEFSYTIFVFLFIFTVSTGIRIIMQWQQSEKEKVNAELAFLKAQINPHFLFNTLNNIYSMSFNKDERTTEAIEMFSDMMRFVIYETCHEFVPLSKKFEYIDTYISLQKLRLSDSVKVNYQKLGDAHSLHIAPLILMPFIENAFKYGVSTEKDSIIDIIIAIDNDELDLSVKNSKFQLQRIENETTRVGVENTIKRLQLIYPGRHTLSITDNSVEYFVSLHLNLK